MTEMSAEKTVEVARAEADELPETVTEFPEPERLLLHMPVDVRNLSLVSRPCPPPRKSWDRR